MRSPEMNDLVVEPRCTLIFGRKGVQPIPFKVDRLSFEFQVDCKIIYLFKLYLPNGSETAFQNNDPNQVVQTKEIEIGIGMIRNVNVCFLDSDFKPVNELTSIKQSSKFGSFIKVTCPLGIATQTRQKID